MTKEQYIKNSNTIRVTGVFSNDNINTVLSNLDLVKDILQEVTNSEETITSACIKRDIEMKKVRDIMYLALNLDKEKDDRIRKPNTLQTLMNEYELFYNAVFGLEDEMLLDLIPDDVKETVEYILSNDDGRGLNEQERKVLKEYYFEGMTYDDIAEEFGLTRERIRQIIAKGLRKLRHPARAAILKQGIHLYSESRNYYNSEKARLIFEAEKTKAMYEVSGTRSFDVRDLSINELDLSVRAYNCIRRAGILTIGDLLDTDLDTIIKVRNLGRRSLEEICEVLKKKGLKAKFMEDAS